MLGQEDFLVIRAPVERGVNLCDVARQLGGQPKTVSRALARSGAPVATRRRRPSRLDPYRAQVDRLLAEGVWHAKGICRALQAAGDPGQISMLRDYIRPKRARRPGRATVRVETEPGRQLQSEWGGVETRMAGQTVPGPFIVNTLGYSRRFHSPPASAATASWPSTPARGSSPGTRSSRPAPAG